MKMITVVDKCGNTYANLGRVPIVQTLDDLLWWMERLLPHATDAHRGSLLAIRSERPVDVEHVA